MGRPWLIGEAPSRLGDRYHHFPLSGRPARVLCEAAGILPQAGGSTYGRWTWALYEHFETRNLIDRYADATPWSAPAARRAARTFVDDERPRVVVCLGRRVGEAFGAPASWGEWVTWTSVSGDLRYEIVVVPHPSGLSRTMNDPAARALVGRTLNRAIERSQAIAA